MENVGNDYAQHFVETRERPQNYISDGSLDAQFQGYPKLHELVRRKADIIQHTATPPMQLRADLHTLDLTSLGRHFFDVIVVDPDWSHIDDDFSDTNGRADPQRWNFNQLANLRIPDIAASPSFVFLWAGNGRGLDLGRKLLVKWGYRRCEDIVWVKTNKHSRASSAPEPKAVLEHTKEHCLMGIRGTARRSTDSHFIHCNVDTDVIVAEESPQGTRRKPIELFHIIEHFCLGRRRLYLFGDSHCARPGWVTVGSNVKKTDFDVDTYRSYFAEPIGHLVPQDPEIESLRPKSPPPRNRHPAGAGNGRSVLFGPRMSQGHPRPPRLGNRPPTVRHRHYAYPAAGPWVTPSLISSEFLTPNAPCYSIPAFHSQSPVTAAYGYNSPGYSERHPTTIHMASHPPYPLGGPASPLVHLPSWHAGMGGGGPGALSTPANSAIGGNDRPPAFYRSMDHNSKTSGSSMNRTLGFNMPPQYYQPPPLAQPLPPRPGPFYVERLQQQLHHQHQYQQRHYHGHPHNGALPHRPMVRPHTPRYPPYRPYGGG